MRYLILAASAVLLLAACGAASTSIPPTVEGLAGREFWSTAVAGHDLVRDTRVRLVFDQDGSLGASAGCNSMGGTWSLDGTTLHVEIAQMTEMACVDDRMAQDDWLIDWLAGGLTARLDAEGLVLAGNEVAMTLQDRDVADPDQPAAGTT